MSNGSTSDELPSTSDTSGSSDDSSSSISPSSSGSDKIDSESRESIAAADTADRSYAGQVQESTYDWLGSAAGDTGEGAKKY